MTKKAKGRVVFFVGFIIVKLLIDHFFLSTEVNTKNLISTIITAALAIVIMYFIDRKQNEKGD